MVKLKKNKFLDACNIYIILWVLWFVQGLITSSSTLSLLFYTPFFLMSIYYVIKVLTTYKPSGAMMALCVFFMVLVIYGVVLLIINDVHGLDRKSFLMMLFWSLGPIFSFYVFTRQGLLTEKRLKHWLIVFIVLLPFIFIHSRQMTMKAALEYGTQYEETTNNASYMLAGIFPFVFLLNKKPLYQYLFIAFVFFFVVTGLKRGAMLVTAIQIMWFVFVSIKSSKRKRIGVVLLTVIFFAIGYRYVLRYYEQSAYFQNRIEDTMNGDSSSRDVLYERLFDHWKNNDNILQIVFGEGAYHTENIIFCKAHSDWLEILIDCGLFGILLYLIYWLSFIREWGKTKRNYLVYSMMGACLFFTMIRSVFSMSFCDMPLFTSMIMGYCFACANSKKTAFNSIANE